AVVAVIFAAGVFQGEPLALMFLTGVSLAVAAVPEGLPVVVTIALALGSQRMLRRNALIKKLPAIETLGSVTTICSDKTGTLTQDKMSVVLIDLFAETIELREESATPHDRPDFTLLVAASSLCNDAILQSSAGENSAHRAIGDPTEVALLEAALRFGLRKHDLELVLPRVQELPFTSERKRMTTVHRLDRSASQHPVWSAAATIPQFHSSKFLVFSKGAVDGLLSSSRFCWGPDGPRPLDVEWVHRFKKRQEELAKQGMRLLGVGVKLIVSLQQETPSLENDLIFLGMVAMMDLPRHEAAEAVQICKSAGIRAVMITGDHPMTALHIANRVGLVSNQNVLTGTNLAKMDVEALAAELKTTSVFARVSPADKLQIIKALQQEKQIVAMTGDGVNDAPALRKADVGIAMGITGTDVAKEAADMVLLDDNFATIVAAVREGRVIYDNIRKFVRYILTTNSSELWVMVI
ncbi:MAG TPA: HAD-IC family P-type ATPase, partial [Acidobacteriota bacterium]